MSSSFRTLYCTLTDCVLATKLGNIISRGDLLMKYVSVCQKMHNNILSTTSNLQFTVCDVAF